MRVSTAYRYDGLSAAIRSTDARVQTAQQRITDGRRITKPSDDAGGTRQLLGIGGLRSGIAAYTKNLDVAKGVLASSEAAYGDLGDLVQQAQSLAIQGATSAIDPAARDAVGDQIATLQGRLVSLGNAQAPDGRYLFGGQLTDAKPFSVDAAGGLAYAGNAVVPTAETGPGETAKVGETGGAISKLYDDLTRLRANLASGDTTAISNDRLKELTASSDALIVARGDVGRRMNDVEASRATHARRETDLSQRASDVGEVDYASAVVEFTAAQSAYQAALQVATKGFSMGLMDFIR